MAAEATEPTFYLVGNLLCLDLVNTEAVARGESVDLLRGFPDLIDWLRAADLLTEASARTAAKRWGGTADGEVTFREAVALRAALRALAERLAAGKSVSQESVAAINRVLATRPAYRQLTRRGKEYATRLQPVTESALHLLVPVAESAARLLEHGDPSLVRRCGNPTCVLYFYDTTKNKSRRWCSMDACGSRAKAAAYYQRTRSLAR